MAKNVYNPSIPPSSINPSGTRAIQASEIRSPRQRVGHTAETAIARENLNVQDAQSTSSVTSTVSTSHSHGSASHNMSPRGGSISGTGNPEPLATDNLQADQLTDQELREKTPEQLMAVYSQEGEGKNETSSSQREVIQGLEENQQELNKIHNAPLQTGVISLGYDIQEEEKAAYSRQNEEPKAVPSSSRQNSPLGGSLESLPSSSTPNPETGNPGPGLENKGQGGQPSAGETGGGGNLENTDLPRQSDPPSGIESETISGDNPVDMPSGQPPESNPGSKNVSGSYGWVLNLKGTRLLAKALGGFEFGNDGSNGFNLKDFRIKLGFNLTTEIGASPVEPNLVPGFGGVWGVFVKWNKFFLNYEAGQLRIHDSAFNENIALLDPRLYRQDKIIFSRFGIGVPLKSFAPILYANTTLHQSVHSENTRLSFLHYFLKRDENAFTKYLISLNHPSTVFEFKKPVLPVVVSFQFDGHVCAQEKKIFQLLPFVKQNSEELKPPLIFTSSDRKEEIKEFQNSLDLTRQIDNFRAESRENTERLALDLKRLKVEQVSNFQYLHKLLQFGQKQSQKSDQLIIADINKIKIGQTSNFANLQEGLKIWQNKDQQTNKNIFDRLDKYRFQEAQESETLQKSLTELKNNQEECCDLHTNKLDDITSLVGKSNNATNQALKSIFGAGFTALTVDLLSNLFNGFFISLVIGLSFSFLYLVFDYYLIVLSKKKFFVAKPRLNMIIYSVAFLGRFYCSFGLFGAFLMCYGFSLFTTKRVPLFNFFDELATSAFVNSDFKQIAVSQQFFQVLSFLNYPLKVGFASISVYYTSKKVLLVGHNFGLFSILFGSSFVFSFCRLRLFQFYKEEKDRDKSELPHILTASFSIAVGIPCVLNLWDLLKKLKSSEKGTKFLEGLDKTNKK